MRVLRPIARVLAAVAWLAVAAVVAFGGAGVVAAMNHVPSTAARPELTWAGDLAATAALDVATDRLQALTAATDALGSTGRQALATVTSGNTGQLNALVSVGTLQARTVDADAAALGDALRDVPGVGIGSALTVSSHVQDRFDQLVPTRLLVSGLAADWLTFTGRALDAANLSALLSRHDQQTAAAARQGAQAKYADALSLLEASDATIAQMKGVRDRLANTTDVSTLTTWIDRNAAYDAALRKLYGTLRDAKGKVTQAVRDAYTREQKARAKLPADTRGIIVIMADVAQGGLNQAVIAIEEARGELSDAFAVQRQLQRDVEIAPPG